MNTDEGWWMNMTNLHRKLKKTRNSWRIWKTSNCAKELVIHVLKAFFLTCIWPIFLASLETEHSNMKEQVWKLEHGRTWMENRLTAMESDITSLKDGEKTTPNDDES